MIAFNLRRGPWGADMARMLKIGCRRLDGWTQTGAAAGAPPTAACGPSGALWSAADGPASSRPRLVRVWPVPSPRSRPCRRPPRPPAHRRATRSSRFYAAGPREVLRPAARRSVRRSEGHAAALPRRAAHAARRPVELGAGQLSAPAGPARHLAGNPPADRPVHRRRRGSRRRARQPALRRARPVVLELGAVPAPRRATCRRRCARACWAARCPAARRSSPRAARRCGRRSRPPTRAGAWPPSRSARRSRWPLARASSRARTGSSSSRCPPARPGAPS